MYTQLTREQRYAIYLGIQEGRSQSAIARQINVDRSTVSRELRRNSNRWGRYIWKDAHESALYRRERTPGNRGTDRSILKEALRLLRSEDWSPRQISGYLRIKGMQISHETIYRHIREDESGVLRKHCRHGMKYRRHRKVARKTRVRNIPDRVSIHERPSEADGRRFGDWEMDLIVGKGQKGHILTLCERSTNYMLMRRLPQGRRPEAVAETVIDMLFQYRRNVLTITTDNGVEFRHHARIAKALNTTVYFADSYASWQKGAIENTNKLIRQYIPKGTDFRDITDDYIHEVQLRLNRRPRNKLNFSSPKDRFFNLLL
uniref:Integrase catalytic domain-containing protein n=1 Tax=uncultured prokaryote TaxID=198431 RepID=A0A0H5Q636_9ZZZZ|nr:hypothetical protein [uncultured prokaryote]